MVQFTDQEWKAIDSSLPPSRYLRRRTDSMRRDVEAQLNFFLKYRNSLWTALWTKRAVKRIKGYVPKLRRDVAGLIDDPVFLSAGLPMGRVADYDFGPLLRNLERLQDEMDSTESRTLMMPGRKSVAPIDFLVAFLNWIQNDVTRDNVIRSNKRTEKASASTFIHLCCQKVGLSKGQVDRSLKRNISKFHNLLSHGVDLSTNPFGTRNHKSVSKRARPKSKS